MGSFAGGLRLFNAEIPVQFATKETMDNPKILIFPNPVYSQLRIVSSEGTLRYATIADVYGRRCKEFSLTGTEETIEVSELPSGVYLLALVLEDGLVNRIFLKR